MPVCMPSPGPSFRFVEADSTTSEDAATVVWVLETNGIRPLLEYSLTLTTGPGPDGLVFFTSVVLEDEVADETVFSRTFEGLEVGVMYSLEISGRNSMHASLPTFFTFETLEGKHDRTSQCCVIRFLSPPNFQL